MAKFVALWKTTPSGVSSLLSCSRGKGLEVVECASGEVAELVLVSTGTELRALATDVELGGEASGPELAQYANANSRT
ncbi:hypothetical protein [Bradyrhizobium valentinum]|uniref:hypothetical protein n=1 Tax=Bradyrhizobium valentinum TaxID=1518501 RepID=UPI000ABBCD18|nr:hypothetical protein [Bradyrhizobium valentinum]